MHANAGGGRPKEDARDDLRAVRVARADGVTALVIDALVDHLREVHSQSPERVCPHALPEAFERSPRPLVLDVVRGILACADTCYPRRAQSSPRAAACFRCAGPVGGLVTHNLLIAHGPFLVAAALCPTCSTQRLRRVPYPWAP